MPGWGLSSVGSCAVGAGVIGFVGWWLLLAVVVVSLLLLLLLVSACARAGGAQEPTRTFLSVTCHLGEAARCY